MVEASAAAATTEKLVHMKSETNKAAFTAWHLPQRILKKGGSRNPFHSSTKQAKTHMGQLPGSITTCKATAAIYCYSCKLVNPFPQTLPMDWPSPLNVHTRYHWMKVSSQLLYVMNLGSSLAQASLPEQLYSCN